VEAYCEDASYDNQEFCTGNCSTWVWAHCEMDGVPATQYATKEACVSPTCVYAPPSCTAYTLSNPSYPAYDASFEADCPLTEVIEESTTETCLGNTTATTEAECLASTICEWTGPTDRECDLTDYVAPSDGASYDSFCSDHLGFLSGAFLQRKHPETLQPGGAHWDVTHRDDYHIEHADYHTCSDGVQNGPEDDVDCGGTHTRVVGDDEDCTSCSPPPSPPPPSPASSSSVSVSGASTLSIGFGFMCVLAIGVAYLI